MDEIDLETAVGIAVDALHADRLALLCGAGLSMASPSNLPSAEELAAIAKRSYDALHGTTRPPLPAGIEEQAELFFQRGELGTVYLRTLIDRHAFAGSPNRGHEAVADLLLVRAIHTAASTNVDTLIETAGMSLLGQVGVGIDRNGVVLLPPDVSPLLKIHGCWARDPDNTVWAPGQLAAEPVMSRIAGSSEWLSQRLLDRDLLVLGFFTDWDYLNGVLERALGDVRPARVLIANPGAAANLAGKAPALHRLGERATSRFVHVRESGDVFLDALRTEFSRSFVRRIMYSGSEAYQELKGTPPDATWLEPDAGVDGEALWRVRRDLEGCLPGKPSLARVPPDEPALGLTILELRAAGATADGPYWVLGRQRIRVLRSANKLLHQVQRTFARETAPAVAPDIVIAVGAESSSLPDDIVRGGTASTIARGTAGRWLTRTEAIGELGL